MSKRAKSGGVRGSAGNSITDPVPTRTRRFEMSGRTILAAAGLVAGVWLMSQLWQVILVVAVSLILVGTLNPIVAYLERHRMQRPVAVAIIVLALVLIGGGFVLVTAPALWQQITGMVQNLPRFQNRLAQGLAAHPATVAISDTIRHLKLEQVIPDLGARAMSYSSQALVFFGYVATSVALALYLLLDPERSQGGLFAVVPRRFHVRLARILLNLETIVGGYMRGQVVTSLFMMTFVFALLTACRVPNALALAVFAGFTDVIPLIGGLIALTPVVLSAIPKGTGVTLIVLVGMVLYQEFENRVIIPRIYGRALRLSAAMVTVALLIGAQLLGVLGALLALPLAAAVRMVVLELRLELPGETFADSELLARDERAETEYAHLSAGAPAHEAAAIAVQIAEDIRKEGEAAAEAAPVEVAVVPVSGHSVARPRSEIT